MRVPYDVEDPPARPPEGSDPLMWRLAYAVHCDHQPDAAGYCTAGTCGVLRVPWPCSPSRLSALGFSAALGTRAPWSSLNRSGGYR